jgi:hypothetical protein
MARRSPIGDTGRMAFGQASGPPASGRQISDLLELLQRAGHTDFRDARGPMGFTQRQAAGKFTAQEAAEFIEQLEEEEHRRDTGEAPAPDGLGEVSPVKLSAAELALREYPDHQLAAELQRRNWIVVEP